MAMKKLKEKLIMLGIMVIVVLAFVFGEMLVNNFTNKMNSP